MKTWEDVYKLPLRKDKHSDWVYDANNNFVFQFEYPYTQDERAMLKEQKLIIDLINGNVEGKLDGELRYEHEVITYSGIPIIMMRGWGNLTGKGAMNLPSEDAVNIQDTFAQFIIKQLQ